MRLARRDFLAGCTAASAALACGSEHSAPADGLRDGEPEAAPPVCTDPSGAVSVARNHGHRMTIAPEDLAAARAKTYDIRGTSAHAHAVVLEPHHFTAIARGETVVVTSSTDADHAHEIAVKCGHALGATR